MIRRLFCTADRDRRPPLAAHVYGARKAGAIARKAEGIGNARD